MFGKQSSAILLALLTSTSVSTATSWARGFAGGGFRGGDFGEGRSGESRQPEAGTAEGENRFGTAGFDHSGSNSRAFSRDDWARRGNTVRNRFDRRGLYRADWLDHHPNCWRYPGMDNYCWGYTSWPIFAGFWGVPVGGFPPDYDYGANITYQYNNVYSGDQSWTASDYYDQAGSLADKAPTISADQSCPTAILDGVKQAIEKPNRHKPDWKPFGVFSLLQEGETDSTKLFQLAANKDGIIRGNYYDTLTDEVKPVSGAIDKKTMRAAWTMTGNKSVVYDTGVSNLLKPQSPILVHFNKDKTEQWTLVRLKS